MAHRLQRRHLRSGCGRRVQRPVGAVLQDLRCLAVLVGGAVALDRPCAGQRGDADAQRQQYFLGDGNVEGGVRGGGCRRLLARQLPHHGCGAGRLRLTRLAPAGQQSGHRCRHVTAGRQLPLQHGDNAVQRQRDPGRQDDDRPHHQLQPRQADLVAHVDEYAVGATGLEGRPAAARALHRPPGDLAADEHQQRDEHGHDQQPAHGQRNDPQQTEDHRQRGGGQDIEH